MKLKTQLYYALAASVLFASCANYTTPKSVSVKTNAQYPFTIANFEKDLGDYFNLKDKLPSSDSIQIYDYNPNSDAKVQKFLLKIPVQEVPLDFGDYLSDSSLSTVLKNMSISEQKVTIPKFDINKTQTVELSQLNTMINKMVTITGQTSNLTSVTFHFDEGNGFTKIEYNSGNLVIKGIDDTIDGTVALYHVTKYSDLEKKSPETWDVISEAEFTSSGTAKLDLTNVTLYSTDLWMNFSNGNHINFIGTVDDKGDIKAVTGISRSENVEVPVSVTIPTKDEASTVYTCSFGTGSTLTYKITLPSEWTGVSLIDTSTTLSGGMKPETTITAGENDISGKSLSNDDISADANLVIKLSNANLYLDKNPEISISANISTLASIELPNDFSTSFSKTQLFSEDTKDTVESITWKETGLRISCKNTFPEGNDMQIKASSSFLGITEKTDTLKCNTDETQTIDYFCEDGHTTKIGDGAGEFSGIDFNAELTLPEYNVVDGVKIATFKNIEMGATYYFSISVEPIFDWEKVSLNISDQTYSSTVSSGVNLSSLFSSFDSFFPGADLGQKLKISKLPIYLYFDAPAVKELGDITFQGYIRAFLGKEDSDTGMIVPTDGVESVYLLGASDDLNATMPIRSTPALKIDENGSVTSDLSTEVQNADLAPLINYTTSDSSDPGAICLDYNLSRTSTATDKAITIYKDTLGTLSSSSVCISAIVILSMDFDVNSDIDIDVNQLLASLISSYDSSNTNSDILGRTEATNTTDIQKYVDVIENVTIISKPTKLPFLSSGDISLGIDLDSSGDVFDKQDFKLSGGNFSVSPTDLLNTFPLHPALGLSIPKGTFSLPREMIFSTNISICIETDGTIKLF